MGAVLHHTFVKRRTRQCKFRAEPAFHGEPTRPAQNKHRWVLDLQSDEPKKGGAGERDMPRTKKWSSSVKTVSTSPPEDLFTKDAITIARVMSTKKVSPKGLGSGIRMIQFFINRAGKSLPTDRKRELEKAKKIMQAKLHA